MRKGFTLIEILIVITIISIFSGIVFAAVSVARERATYAEALHDFDTLHTALELYKADNGGQLPPDTDRNIPPGLGPYLAGGAETYWPNGPWPGSVFDWENWTDLSNPSLPPTAQISIRFCPFGSQQAKDADGNPSPDYSNCQFPPEPWAKYFQPDSALYYCISGSCKSHEAETIPGYCVNCAVQPDPPQ